MLPEFGKRELQSARESRKVPRWQLAQVLNVSDSTVERWESTRPENLSCLPDPDEVDKIAEFLGYPTMWHEWMLSNHASYRKRYKGMENYGLTASVMRVRHELLDVLALQDQMERGVVTGTVADVPVGKAYKEQAREAIAILQQAVDQIPD